MTDKLLRLDDVSVRFAVGKRRFVDALNGVSLSLGRGETLGLVGESGCGKSTLARVVMGAIKPTGGSVLIDGEPLDVRGRAARLEHARKAQMVFQDPASSLDPRMTVEDIVAENLEIHGMKDRRERRRRVFDLLEMVGLPAASANRFPHEFSGGQRQRIGIARALAVSPQLVVCDEPTSALDASVQGQVINVLRRLRADMNLSYLFISHNLDVVRCMSDRIAVMYAGSVVELADAGSLYARPLHPYTQALLGAMLSPDPAKAALAHSAGVGPLASVASTSGKLGAGCSFAPRCPRAVIGCQREHPALVEEEPGHWVACSVRSDAVSA